MMRRLLLESALMLMHNDLWLFDGPGTDYGICRPSDGGESYSVGGSATSV